MLFLSFIIKTIEIKLKYSVHKCSSLWMPRISLGETLKSRDRTRWSVAPRLHARNNFKVEHKIKKGRTVGEQRMAKIWAFALLVINLIHLCLALPVEKDENLLIRWNIFYGMIWFTLNVPAELTTSNTKWIKNGGQRKIITNIKKKTTIIIISIVSLIKSGSKTVVDTRSDQSRMVDGFIPGSIRSLTIIVIMVIFAITATELLTTTTLIGPESSDKKVPQTWISPQLFSLSTNLRFFSS